ncbi:uncharacterized protein GLRG_01944 [Colletotrichum graminicola M1.001]|uniref:Uncharacterized protein n=1 Tax=Colletotrichum graminicola (strain M1.001 / M2 / FGSC 10212) TaxID=645133 RepID=E3Q8T5_COLGM|nr:uncharacterized protein GLRG_01944 [Colletotrichum graminicola M1.001]EFQ27449.1 hypothetical protein GLRG_01944 [Colletotrichum graminicola M1.001]
MLVKLREKWVGPSASSRVYLEALEPILVSQVRSTSTATGVIPARYPPPPYPTSPVRDAKFRDNIRASVASYHAIPGTILKFPIGLTRPLKCDLDSCNAGSIFKMLRPGGKMIAARNVVKGSFTGKFAEAEDLGEVGGGLSRIQEGDGLPPDAPTGISK